MRRQSRGFPQSEYVAEATGTKGPARCYSRAGRPGPVAPSDPGITKLAALHTCEPSTSWRQEN